MSRESTNRMVKNIGRAVSSVMMLGTVVTIHLLTSVSRMNNTMLQHHLRRLAAAEGISVANQRFRAFLWTR